MKHPTVLHAILPGAAGLLIASQALATTWVVDDNGGPGVDFVTIQAAVDAATDGDVIEVREGAYPGFTIDGKALVVRGVEPSVRVAAVVLVTNVDATRRVELDRLEVGLQFSGPREPSIVVAQCPGSVRLIDCIVKGKSSFGYDCSFGVTEPAQSAVVAEESDELTLLRCELRGGNGFYPEDYYYCGRFGADALLSTSQSTLTVLDCLLVGGTGARNENGWGGYGGDGAELRDSSTIFAHRSQFSGGSGGIGGCDDSCFGVSCFPGQSLCGDGADGEGVDLLSGATMTWKSSTFDSIDGTAQEVAIAPYCLGTSEECPCGNNGAGTAGCEHSFDLGGARLEGVGNASVSADTVTLQLTGLGPNGAPTALFFQGTTGSEGTPFNDGLLCAGGTIRRLKGKAASNGTVSFGFGQPGDAAVSVAGAVPPAGATRYYQVWYRNNNASYCTPQRFNMSNGVEIAWAP